MLHLNCEGNSPLWHFLKMYPNRLSATQVSPALRIGGSTKSLIEKKRGKQTWKPGQLKVPAIQHGLINEALSISKARGFLDPENEAIWMKPGIVMDPVHPVCLSPDAMFFKNDRLFGLEVKTPFSRPLPLSPERVSTEHLVQCFVSVSVTRARSWFLFYYSVSEDRAVLFSVFPDKDLWENLMLPEVKRFLKLLRGKKPLPKLEKDDKAKINLIKKRLRSKVQRLLLWQLTPAPGGSEPESCASRGGR